MNNNAKVVPEEDPLRRDRKRTYREKLSTLCRHFIVYLLSTGGLSIALVAYSILGGFVFMYIESPKEERTRSEVRETLMRRVQQLWEVTAEMNVLYQENWTVVAEGILDEFSEEVFRATKLNGWDGSNEERELQWSYAGSLLYSITVITTIGYGHIAPKTDAGKVVTIFYAVFGIPLTMLTLTNIGSFMAILFRFLYKNLVCAILCGRCQRCRKSTLRQNDVGAIVNDVTATHDHVVAVETRADVEKCYEYEYDAGSVDGECYVETVCGRREMGSCGQEEGAFEDYGRIVRTENGSFEWRIFGKKLAEKRLSDGGLEIEMPGRVGDAYYEDLEYLRYPEVLQESTRRSQDDLDSRRGLPEAEMDGSLIPAETRARPESSSIGSDPDEPEEELLGPSESATMMMVEAKLVGDPERPTSASVRSVTFDRDGGKRPLTEVKHRLMKWRRGFQIVLYADDNKRVKVPIYVSVLVMTVYVIAGSLLFTLWEKNWDYLEGSYFCFITLSTIGFGDYVPGTSVDDWSSQDKLVLCALYLVFGLALIAMCFDLMQEEVRARCRAFARNIGLIKEEGD